MIPAAFETPAFLSNPYPTYAHLLEDGPIQKINENQWLVLGHPETTTLLKSPQVGMGEGPHLPPPHLRSMLFLDPPEHTRMRTLVSQAFTPTRIAGLEPKIRQVARDLLTRARHKGTFDLVADFARPLPLLVIADLLGMPEADRPRLLDWTPAVVRRLDPRPIPEAELPGVQAAAGEFYRCVRTLSQQRKNAPQDDLLSKLMQVQHQGEHLSEGEVLSTFILLLVAGFETTMNLVSMGLLALLEHPEQRQHLQANPSLMEGATEELLRYTSPSQMVYRMVLQDFELFGQKFKTGDGLRLVLAAANRDPRVFTHPQALDVTRSAGRHLSFAHGVHYCLGAPLARLEARVALEELLKHDLKATGPLNWNENITVRGLKQLVLETPVHG